MRLKSLLTAFGVGAGVLAVAIILGLLAFVAIIAWLMSLR
jgi:hypothetical protein